MASTIIGYIPKKDIIDNEPFKEEVKEVKETKKKTTRKTKEEKED